MFGPDSRQCFNLTIVDDNITEPCERFMYDIDNVGGLLSLQSVTVTINDDERKLIWILKSASSSFGVELILAKLERILV